MTAETVQEATRAARNAKMEAKEIVTDGSGIRAEVPAADGPLIDERTVLDPADTNAVTPGTKTPHDEAYMATANRDAVGTCSCPRNNRGTGS